MYTNRPMTAQPTASNLQHSLRIAVIGGGAAGFLSAITAKELAPQADVSIFEKERQVLAKVAVTGGGHCNATNTFQGISDLKQVYPRGSVLMKRLFKQFGQNETYQWFANHGAELAAQDDGRMFPVTRKSSTIVSALTSAAERIGVKIFTGHRLEGVSPMSDGTVALEFSGGHRAVFDRVAITTGGTPHGEMLETFAALGHEIETPVPSLFSFNIADDNLRQMPGTTANAIVSIPSTKFTASGSLLVTHWGMSGPAILRLSSYAARHLHNCSYQSPLLVNWTGEGNHQNITSEIQSTANRCAHQKLGSVRLFGLSARLWLYLLGKAGLPEERHWGEIGKKGINKLTEVLGADRYAISGKGIYKDEFVTCGGVSLRSINLNTLESKSCRHLYFAGEVLDIDAVTGGFNLQAAWTTGYTAGRSLIEA